MGMARWHRRGRWVWGFILVALVAPLWLNLPSGLWAQQQPVLEVSPASLTFQGELDGPPPEPRFLTLANAGGGLLQWQASADADWITLGASEGALSGGRAIQLAVLVDTQGLGAGTYEGTITIADPQAEGSPTQVAVTLTLTDQRPRLEVSPTKLNFSARLGDSKFISKTLTIRNTGGQSFTWSAQENLSCLSFDRLGGALQPHQSVEVRVFVNLTILQAGTRQGTITITAPGAQGSPAHIPVILDLANTSPEPALPAPGPLLFQDDFNDPCNGWYQGEDQSFSWWCEAGKYHVKARTPGLSGWIWNGPVFKDFSYEVDAQQVSGSLGSYGIIFRLQDVRHFYHLQVNRNGAYALQRYVDGTWVDIEEWQESPAVNKGDNTNHLKVVVRGPEILVYVNSVLLATAKDTTYSEGRIGFIIGPWEGPMHVAFDNLKIFSVLNEGDRDGDGVPDDEDYCPDFPGKPETNGC